jgi:hypothetical protein
MKLQASYEVTDMRDIAPHLKLLYAANIYRYGPVLELRSLNNAGLVVDLTDEDEDDPMFEDRPDERKVIFHTPEGIIVLEELNLANWRRSVLPFVGDDGQVFSRDHEVNEYFHNRIHTVMD